MHSDWELLQIKLQERFGSKMDYDSILFLIGLQELGKPFKRYKKDEKLEVMHIAICTLLEPYGFYEYEGRDEDGWPHWKSIQKMPRMNLGEQDYLLKQCVVDYFKEHDVFI